MKPMLVSVARRAVFGVSLLAVASTSPAFATLCRDRRARLHHHRVHRGL